MDKQSLISDENKIEEVLNRGVANVYPTKETLEKVLRSGKKIRLYQGFDPSMPNLHLGNLVGVLKLKQFQDLGHEVIFLVGDFTGMIGDPTDKSSTRQRLTREQTRKNAENWQGQAGKFLRFEGENPAKLMFNSVWLDKVSFKDLIEISANFTVQQMLERDFFQKRLKENKPIYLHEFLYPVAVSIDCIEMDVDLEIGGDDQTFNMLAGRTLMKALKGKEKFVLTTKLLVDAQGNKVGKTAGNALFLNASVTDMYGGIMSFPDEVLIDSFELLTLIPMEQIREIEKEIARGKNPMEVKKQLAFEIVKLHHGESAAQKAQQEFEKIFQKREIPTQNIQEFRVTNSEMNPIDLLVNSGLAPSRSEAKRLIEQGAVELDQFPIPNSQFPITLKDGSIIRVGKRKFIKIRINP